MLCGITVIDNNVIDYTAEAGEVLKSFIHASIIVLRYRGNSVWCTCVFISAKWHYESGEKLVFLVKGALVIAFLSIQNSEELTAWETEMSGIASAWVGDWYLSLFTYLFKCEWSTTHTYEITIFLGATTIGTHQSVASVTGVIVFCDSKRSSSASSLSW